MIKITQNIFYPDIIFFLCWGCFFYKSFKIKGSIIYSVDGNKKSVNTER